MVTPLPASLKDILSYLKRGSKATYRQVGRKDPKGHLNQLDFGYNNEEL